ncbi:hypothetical protein ACOZB2_23600 [Pantoea endophytica]|uniref:DUF4199 domain-containing protein n=1 Tax=Pantoea sp. BJ2 TaxID=3141322 RepID=A0AAU7TTQ4_9GAMM
MRLVLNLPNRLIFSLTLIISCLISVLSFTPSDFKIEFLLSIAAFTLLTILSGIRLRMGKLEALKNTVNALWNIETACAFCYGFYLFYDYTLYGIEQPKSLTSWARDNPVIFSMLSVGLGFIAIFRASISLVEIFKESIEKSKCLEKNKNKT